MGLSNRLPAHASGDTADVLGQRLPLLPGSVTGAGLALVRPEAITLEADPAGHARVVSVGFLGPISRVQFTVPDSSGSTSGALGVAQLASSLATTLSPGDQVAVRIEPAPVLVVADEV